MGFGGGGSGSAGASLSTFLKLGTELTVGTQVVDNIQSATADTIIGLGFALPTTEKYYVISAIEWINGTVVAGNVHAGVMMVDAEPPVSTQIIVVAQTGDVAQTPVSTLQKAPCNSMVLRGGSRLLMPYINLENAAATVRWQNALANQNRLKVVTYANFRDHNITAWTAAVSAPNLKVYVRPVIEQP